GHVRIADPLAEDPFERMLAAAKVVLELELLLRGGSLVGNLVAFVPVVNQNQIGLVGLHPADVNLPWYQVKGFRAENFETVFVRILDIVAVGNARAFGASVIEGIVAAFLATILVGKVRFSSQCLDGLIENGPRFAGVVGVVEINGRLSGSSRRGSGRRRGLGGG